MWQLSFTPKKCHLYWNQWPATTNEIQVQVDVAKKTEKKTIQRKIFTLLNAKFSRAQNEHQIQVVSLLPETHFAPCLECL